MISQWRDGPPVKTNLFDHIVTQRSITNLNQFIQPTWPDSLHPCLELPDIEKACARIWQAILRHESIGIMGDYDMDGTPAAAIVASFLKLFAINPHVILPTRTEGYGFSTTAVDRFIASGVSLIITVDCGVRDSPSVAKAREHSCDVIITDHHECPSELPDATAIVNPKRADSNYPFQGLCGAAVAFKLVQSLIITAPDNLKNKIPQAFAEWLLDLVALATIADMVPLTSENRTLVYYGLKVLRRGARPGLRRLIQSLDLPLDTLDVSDIAFKIIPKCNACGRLDRMDEVYTLLVSQDNQAVEKAVQTILMRGIESQKLLAEMVESAQKKLEKMQPLAPVVVVADDAWHPGLTGLVAARLVDIMQRPVAVLAGASESFFRGSMRSIEGINLVTLLSAHSHYLEHFGGHEGAAGLTIRQDQLHQFSQSLASQEIIPKTDDFITDGTALVDHITLDSLDNLSQLKPWGTGNVEPVWSLNNIVFNDPKWLSNGKHLRARIQSNNSVLSGIFFNAESIRPSLTDRLDICGTASINEFRGNRTPQFQVRSFRPSNKV